MVRIKDIQSQPGGADGSRGPLTPEIQASVIDSLAKADRDACLATLEGRYEIVPITGARASGAQTCYAYSRPEYAVAQGMAQGRQASAVLAEWREAMQDLLSQFRQNRRASVMLEAVSVLRHVDEPHPLLIERAPDQNASEAIDQELQLALACLAVQRDPETQKLCAELEASTVPLPGWDQPPPIDTDRIAAHWAAQQTNQEALEEVRQAAERTERSLQAKLDNAEVQVASLEAINSSLEGESALIKADKTELEADQQQKKDLEEENELLLLQLHQVQEELEQYYLENLDLKKKADASE